MNDEELYLFDLQGYLVIEGVLSATEVAELNRLVDEQQLPPPAESIESQRFGGFLLWGEPFRTLLDHPRILLYLEVLLGDGFRLDHYYGIHMATNTEGLRLHGGGTPYEAEEYYVFRERMFNGLSVVTWALTDSPPGQGGFACIPGSHKSNYPCPEDIRHFERDPGCVAQVPMRAGDVVVFTEALTHGTHPWTAAHQRRSLLYKYAPKHLAWGRYDRHRNDAVHNLLTERQRRLMEPPYIPDRQPIVGTDGPDGVYD